MRQTHRKNAGTFERRGALTALACLIIMGALVSPAHAEDSTVWRKIADDLDFAEIEGASGTLFTPRIALFRTSLTKYRAAVVRSAEFGLKRSDVRKLARLSNAQLVVNANFFDEYERPLGLVVSKGITFSNMHKGGSTLTGVFFSTRAKIGIVNRSAFRAVSVLEAVQAGPRLITNGTVNAALQASETASRRSGVCIDSKGRLILFCSVPGLAGLSLQETQDLLRKPAIDCVHALNFDGGSSSQLYFASKVPGASHDLTDLFYPGGDDVPIGLALYLKR